MDELFQPDFKEIASSSLWKEQILPWLRQDYQAALEECAGVGKGFGPQCIGEAPTQREIDWWSGFLTALKTIMDNPELQAAAVDERKDYEQEQQHEIIRQQTERRRRDFNT